MGKEASNQGELLKCCMPRDSHRGLTHQSREAREVPTLKERLGLGRQMTSIEGLVLQPPKSPAPFLLKLGVLRHH